MPSTIRAKLAAIVAVAAAALITLVVVGTVVADRVRERHAHIRDVYVPLVELRPQLQHQFTRLGRSLQDAVAAMDLDALDQAQSLKSQIAAQVDAARVAVDGAAADELIRALDAYYDIGVDVSRRLIANETGERIVEAIAEMQARQAAVERLLESATVLDRTQIARAFSLADDEAERAKDIRLTVSLASLALLALLSVWLGRGIVRSLSNLSAGFERFGRGAFDVPIPADGDDELAQVASRANAMAESLERLGAERDRVAWLDKGHAGLVEELRGELEPSEAASRALHYLADTLGAPVGALYLTEPQGALRAAAQVAGPGNESAAVPSFAPGEGLVGEAAQRAELRVLTDAPAGYLRVRSGLGEASPLTIVLLPLRRTSRCIGVLELGLLQPLSEPGRELLHIVRDTLAIALDMAQTQTATRALLRETQAQAARLARQDEELRTSNEELLQQHEELRQTNEELVEQAQELELQRRTLEEQNEALDEARRRIEQKNTELSTVSAYKSQFLANMSHELRTPLNSMLLLSNLLTENTSKNLTDKQVDYCRTIYAAGADLRDLINQVLDLAKVESGKQEVRIEDVRIADLLDRARRVFDPLARDKGLELSLELLPGLPETIRSDRQRVDQILTNLLGNAIKFTPSGSVGLRVYRPGPDIPARIEGPVVALAVWDTGPGIPVDQQHRVFEPFEQIERKADRRYGGTGLGLALARELSGLLGGALHLESVVGEGTTFTCYLPERGPEPRQAKEPPTEPKRPDEPGGAQPNAMPAARPTVASARPSRPPRPPEAESNAAWRLPPEVPRLQLIVEGGLADDRDQLEPGEPYLLLIEDDRIFAETFGDVIHGHGLKFIIAADGREGVRLARERRPAGIILDMRLPDTDGFAVMEELKGHPATETVPVHFVSAEDASERGLAMGAAGYLVKSASRRDLVGVLESLVPKLAQTARRVLVVEDDAEAGKSLVKMLAGEHLEARQATSAGAALDLLAKERFGGMVLDLSLPDMDGLEFLHKVQQQCGPTMPAIVIYTARAMSREETKRLEEYTEAIVLKEGASSARVLNEVRLFVRRLNEGLSSRRQAAIRTAPTSVRLDGRRILVVDDDMRTVYALSAALRAKGAEVLVADTGRVALDVLSQNPDIEAVLMDIMMPEMDGYEAMAAIRRDPRFARLPVVALTAKAMKGDAERCIAAGATDYLPKPIDIERLLRVLDERLRESSDEA